MVVEVLLASGPALLGGDLVLPIFSYRGLKYHRLWVHDSITAVREEGRRREVGGRGVVAWVLLIARHDGEGGCTLRLEESPLLKM